MAATTPRRSSRVPHMHTPKMSERKKGLFQSASEPPRESLTTHRQLPVVDSESDSEDCDLGIISTLDSSSGDENDQGTPKTPKRTVWHGTRSQTHMLLKENHDLKNFIKSPFTLKKYQTRYSGPETRYTGSASNPATPHLQNHPGTPSSTHSCTSIHTNSSTSSRARKSLASLIADTESCSSSLKDLNFDTDSGTDSKENTPTKAIRRSSRKQKMTMKFQSFKGILVEQKKNLSPIKTAVVCLTKMDMSSIISPTQMLKTPHNTTEAIDSPPKLGHNRRSAIEIAESPESTCDSDKSHKRLRNDSMTDGPNCKYPRLDVPKARLSLFNSDRLKEILSTKSFYGKTNPELNTNITAKISNAIEVSNTHHRRPFTHSHSNRRKRKPGQINLGVRHRIRKPKHHKNKILNMTYSSKNLSNTSVLNKSTISNISMNDTSMTIENSSQELAMADKTDPFDKEKQTIEALLSQWTEEEVPESELVYTKPREELPCFNSTIIEETNQIFQPVIAVPVSAVNIPSEQESDFIEIGTNQDVTAFPNTSTCLSRVGTSQNFSTLPQNVTALPHDEADSQTMSNLAHDVVMKEPEGHEANHGEVPKTGQFLPVEGGYILVEEHGDPVQEDLPDLDVIERELKMLDEQILQMAQSNNINAEAVLASTETGIPADNGVLEPEGTKEADKPTKLFPIFSRPNPGTSTPSSKVASEKSSKRCLLKDASDQYVIDAGQNKFGATQCAECGIIYQIGDPQDEHDHLVHHNAIDVLRFNGWKEECVVDRTESGRCIRVRGGEARWRRVERVLERAVHPLLGCGAALPRDDKRAYTAYLYIEKKLIVGCLIVEPKTRAYKLIPGDPDCCSVEEYPVKCGVSRVWTHAQHRRRGVAARLVQCARATFLHGAALRVEDLAFSAPTAAGKAFATKYCGSPNFYVYLD